MMRDCFKFFKLLAGLPEYHHCMQLISHAYCTDSSHVAEEHWLVRRRALAQHDTGSRYTAEPVESYTLLYEGESRNMPLIKSRCTRHVNVCNAIKSSSLSSPEQQIRLSAIGNTITGKVRTIHQYPSKAPYSLRDLTKYK